MAARIASGDFTNKGDIVKYVVISILALGTAFAGITLDFAQYRLNTRVKSKLWNKILCLPTEYFDKESPNRVISRITTDTDAALVPFSLVTIMMILIGMIFGVLVSSFSLVGTPIMKWLYVGVAVMVVLTILAIILMVIVGFISANRLASFTAYLSERLSNFKLIKASCSEKSELEKAHELIQNRYKADMIGLIATMSNYLCTCAILFFGALGAFFFGWKYYEQGLITNGQTFIQFNALATSFSGLASILGLVISSFGTGAGQAAKFAAIFDEKDEDTTSGSPDRKSVV